MKRSIKFRLIICSLVLFVAALSVNVFLNSSSVDKLYEESTIAKYHAIGENLKRKLAGSLSAGQGIDEIRNIKQILTKTEKSLKKVDKAKAFSNIYKYPSGPGYAVSVALPNNIIVASTNQNLINSHLPERTLVELNSGEYKKKLAGDFHHYKHSASYYLTFLIHDEKRTLLAVIALTIPEDLLHANKHILIVNNIAPLMSIFFGGIFILLIVLNRMAKNQSDGMLYSKTRISVMVFFVICSAQIAFSTFSAIAFKDLYLKMNEEKARISVGLFKEDIESFLSKDNSFEDLPKQEVLLSKIISKSPELNDITIFDENWHPLFIVTQENAIDCRSATYTQLARMKESLPRWNPKYNVRLHIKQGEETEGYISTNISKSKLFSRLVGILLDSITVLVISILFLVETMILSFNIIEKRTDKKPPNLTTDLTDLHTESPTSYYGLMRPAAFLFLFGIDISISFLPLHMENLYEPIFGLSKDTIMGLPISVEFFFIGLSILISGAWVDRRGWFRPFLFGLLIACNGLIYSWLAPNGLHFIISRAMVGFGYGLTLMASLGFVINYSDWKRKAQALANLSAGIYAGSICGGASGAMIAERFGYNTVFLSGAVIIFSVILYAVIFMRGAIKKTGNEIIEKQKERVKVREISNFITNRTVLSLIFLSSLPAAIAVVGFLNYFCPIYLSRIGVSQSTIGQILMIYGICLIYFGPFISSYMDASKSKRIFIFLGGILGSLAFLVFYVLDGVLAAIIAVLLLGLSSSFVLVSQSVYTLKLQVTQALGEGKAIGIFRSTSRIGQIGGPIIFSALIVTTNINQNIIYFGLVYLLLALLFMLFSQSEKSVNPKGSKKVGVQNLGLKGDAVTGSCNPLTTQDLNSSGYPTE